MPQRLEGADMATIKGVLFDKDGTLIDFTATWREAVEKIANHLAECDVTLTTTLCDAVGYDIRTKVFLPGSPVVAGSVDLVAELMASILPKWSAAEIEDLANRTALEMGADDLAPVARLRETLVALREMGFSLGVATHDAEATAHANIKMLGVDDLFDFVAGYDSGHGHKPGPGMPNAFAKAISADPSETVMVGDSVHDLGAGRAAGCALSVGVLTGPATEAELAPEGDIVLPSIADLPDVLAQRQKGS